MTRFCREIVPTMLTEACGVDAAQATAIGEDVLARALSFAVLGDPDRDVLMVPFVEEVFDHEPLESTLEMRAAWRWWYATACSRRPTPTAWRPDRARGVR
jgi:hypothetical protein